MQTQNQRLTIEELSSKLKPILGSKIDELYFKYTLADTLDEKNEIAHILGALYKKHLGKLLDKKVLLEPPEKSVVSAESDKDYPLSKIVYADKELYDFSLREGDWPRHVCISGMSGSGKTTFALNILNQFIEKEKPFLVFDWKKSFRALLDKDKDVLCFTIGNDNVSNFFKTNINVPPKGVSPREWINVLCDLISESFSVSFGVHKILLETIDEVFEGWGVYKDSKHYPNWMHIKKMLEIKAREAHGREATWYESALRVATVLTFGDFGKVINYEGKRSLSVEDLLDKKIIFELNSLGNIEKKFFSEFILTYIYKLKKAGDRQSNENVFNHAILVDEAHNIFLKNKTNFLSESVTDMIYREMREYGTSLICLDQHLSKLSDTVKGNSACHIAFQQQLPQDVLDVSSLMQLSEKKEYFSQLPVGHAIVKLSERHTQPFLVKVPYSEMRNEIPDDKRIISRMKCLFDEIEMNKFEPEFKEALVNPINIEIADSSILEEGAKVEIFKLSEIQNILLDFVKTQLSDGGKLSEINDTLKENLSRGLYTKEDIEFVINLATAPKIEPVKEVKPKVKAEFGSIYPFYKSLSSEEKVFIKFIIENPKHEYSTVDLYKQIGFSSRKGNVVKNKLMEKGLLEIIEEKNDKGWKKYIRISNYIQTQTNKIKNTIQTK